MKASIDHLPETKQKKLVAMAEAIRAEAPAAGMIVLFGSHARGDWVDDAETGYRSDYDLLVVVETAEAVEDHARWARVKTAARAIAEPSPVTVIVHDFRELNQQIRRGQFFFAELWEQGVVLYDAKRFTLATPKGGTAAERKALVEEYFDQWFTSAYAFFKNYKFSLGEGDLNVAAFLLHQATERYLTTALLVFVGNKPHTHDIEALGKLAAVEHPLLSEPFPMATAADERLFKLLKRAYIESRYSKSYRITAEELGTLGERVKDLAGRVEEGVQGEDRGAGLETSSRQKSRKMNRKGARDVRTREENSPSLRPLCPCGFLSLLDGDRNTLDSDRTPLDGDRISLHGDRGLLYGDRNTLHGDRNTLHGDRVPLDGDRTSLHGNRNTLYGDRIPPDGDRISLHGDRRLLSVDRNTLHGDRRLLDGDRKLLDVDRIPPDVDRIPLHVDRIPLHIDRISLHVDRISARRRPRAALRRPNPTLRRPKAALRRPKVALRRPNPHSTTTEGRSTTTEGRSTATEGRSTATESPLYDDRRPLYGDQRQLNGDRRQLYGDRIATLRRPKVALRRPKAALRRPNPHSTTTEGSSTATDTPSATTEGCSPATDTPSATTEGCSPATGYPRRDGRAPR